MVNPRILHWKVVMVTHAPVISIIVWEWSIDYASFTAMFKPLHSKTNQEKLLCNQSSHLVQIEPRAPVTGAVPINNCLKIWSSHYASLSTILDLLHTNMNQGLVKKYLRNQGSHFEKYGRFPLRMQRKPPWVTALRCQQRWMEHKEGHWLHTAVQWSNVKQWKDQAFSISHYWVMLVWR